jgi:hypothetical protein
MEFALPVDPKTTVPANGPAEKAQDPHGERQAIAKRDQDTSLPGNGQAQRCVSGGAAGPVQYEMERKDRQGHRLKPGDEHEQEREGNPVGHDREEV